MHRFDSKQDSILTYLAHCRKEQNENFLLAPDAIAITAMQPGDCLGRADNIRGVRVSLRSADAIDLATTGITIEIDPITVPMIVEVTALDDVSGAIGVE
jgi:hypothetical protein